MTGATSPHPEARTRLLVDGSGVMRKKTGLVVLLKATLITVMKIIITATSCVSAVLSTLQVLFILILTTVLGPIFEVRKQAPGFDKMVTFQPGPFLFPRLVPFPLSESRSRKLENSVETASGQPLRLVQTCFLEGGEQCAAPAT